MANFFPIFIKSDQTKCLIIGAGKVAAQKTRTLIKHDIKPDIIAPEACDEMKSLIREYGLNWQISIFSANYSKNYNMVIAATSSKQVNRLIKMQLSAKVLFDDTSDATQSNFIIPASIRRENIEIAISSNGKSPYLSKYLSSYIDELLPQLSKEKLDKIYGKRAEIIIQTHGDENLKSKRLEQEIQPLILDLLKKRE